MRATLLVLLFCFSGLLHSAAQSFDCQRAKSPRELTICANADLAALDSKVAAAYEAARAKLSHHAFSLVQSDQRVWLLWLDKVCPRGDFIANCLTWHYNGRLQQLTGDLVTVNGITFYPRAQYGFAADPHSPDDRDPAAPGFSSDEDTWPQIDIQRDKPTKPQAAWNAIIHPSTSSQKPPADADSDGTMRSEDNYTVIAANDRLINISFTGILDLGGAHPLVSVSNNLWWLDKNRKLIASDVFRPDSGWQQKLIDPAIHKLQTGYPDEGLNTGDELRKAVAAVIPRVNTWSLTSSGLTITFQQYEVGPHSLGMPDITFTWDELKPFLAPDLDPSTLPAPIPSQNP